MSANAFRALKVPLLKGRYLDEHDVEGAAWVVVVNEAMARKFFPNEDPIGQQILLRYDPYPVDEIRPRQIVGVVGNVKHFGVGEEAPPFVYAPFEQQPAIFPGGAARAHPPTIRRLCGHGSRLVPQTIRDFEIAITQ